MKNNLTLIAFSIIAFALFFTSCKKENPAVTTGTVTKIETTTADVIGSVTILGSEEAVTQYGHCWSTITGPTVNDNKTEHGSLTDTTDFTSNLTELLPNTKYYVRGYVTNELGTFYGEEVNFTTNGYFKTVKLGAQNNTTTGGFYSFAEKLVYTLNEASNNQPGIDIFCFYEIGNDIALASPGSGITGIFEGTSSPENWTVTDTTRFFQIENTVLTTVQFDALTDTASVIESLYDAASARKKAKLLATDDIYAFETEDNVHGLFKVTNVVPDSIGSVEFIYILKK